MYEIKKHNTLKTQTHLEREWIPQIKEEFV